MKLTFSVVLLSLLVAAKHQNVSSFVIGNKKAVEQLRHEVNDIKLMVDKHSTQIKNRLDIQTEVLNSMQKLNRRLLFLEERTISRTNSASNHKQQSQSPALVRQLSYQLGKRLEKDAEN